jgi:hypothetical protein
VQSNFAPCGTGARHGHTPPHPFYVYKMFFLCEITGGEPRPSLETSEIAFFAEDELPDLSPRPGPAGSDPAHVRAFALSGITDRFRSGSIEFNPCAVPELMREPRKKRGRCQILVTLHGRAARLAGGGKRIRTVGPSPKEKKRRAVARRQG